MTQSQLALGLGVKQANVSKFELHSSRLRLSTLQDLVRTLDGRLQVQAVFESHAEKLTSIDSQELQNCTVAAVEACFRACNARLEFLVCLSEEWFELTFS